MLSAQDSIPFERMFPDGICRVEGNFYSKTIEFQDINYQLSQSEDKDAIFDGWCEAINYFDASVRFQFSFVNSSAKQGRPTASASSFPCAATPTTVCASSTARCSKTSLERGNNGLVKSKYLTFGIEAENYKTAKTPA